jgi:sulfite reductase subunit B
MTAMVSEIVNSPFLPLPAVIDDVEKMTARESVFRLRPPRSFAFRPSQFVQLAILGVGEAPFSICSDPEERGMLELCVRKTGTVTGALHDLERGDVVLIRGPYGNGVPLENLAGRDLVLVAGGLGMAPLRSLVLAVLSRRQHFGRVNLLYGARTPEDVLFKDDLVRWAAAMDVFLTVDIAPADHTGRVGPVTVLFRDAKFDPVRAAAVVIGPPVMYRFVVRELLARGVPESRIYMSLERRMRCGIGECGHCQINGLFVCQDGPVFCYRDVKLLREAI